MRIQFKVLARSKKNINNQREKASIFRLFFFFLCIAINILQAVQINISYHTTKETLLKIKNIISQKEKGAYLRFGDGDVNLATGTRELMQSFNPNLQKEMIEAFLLEAPTIIRGFPLYSKEFNGYEEGMFPGNHTGPSEWFMDLLNKIKHLWKGDNQDLYSHAALCFAATQYPDFCINILRFIKKSNCAILIGNEKIPNSIKNLLFGEECIFIPAPSSNSYNKIDLLEEKCLEICKNNKEYKIIITSMGCSGRALQKRLWKKLNNVFLFDFGSLMDALCGFNSRAWIELTKFDEKKFLKQLESETKIICTAALIDNQFEKRKAEYIKSLNILNSYQFYDPYIIESVLPLGSRSFLNNYSNNVLYTNTNNCSFKNKGVNEACSLLEAFKKLKFKEHDIIVKITGRYSFNSDLFLTTIKENPTVDVFALKISDQVFTGCFAMRYELFKDFLNQLDFIKMEKEMINIEYELALYLKKIESKNNILYINKIDITAPIFGTENIMQAQF